jgi:uncharacterized protein with PQ loop repeat
VNKVEALGMLGGLCLALCGVPQALKTIEQGHSDGITWGLIIMWWLGEVATLTYLKLSERLTWGLTLNYVSNVFFTSIVLYYKINPTV